MTHHRDWALLLVVPSIGFALVPTGLSLNPLDDEKRATSILQILWQVEAAALALSLAVVIFILQAVYSTRPRPPLRGLAEAIRLPAIFYAGVYGLVLTGMVLMGAGDGAPAGWAATWAVIWAALSAAPGRCAIRARNARAPNPMTGKPGSLMGAGIQALRVGGIEWWHCGCDGRSTATSPLFLASARFG